MSRKIKRNRKRILDNEYKKGYEKGLQVGLEEGIARSTRHFLDGIDRFTKVKGIGKKTMNLLFEAMDLNKYKK